MRFLIFLSFIFVFSTTNISASSMSSAQSRQRILQEFRQKLLEEEELQREHGGIPHGGFVIRSGKTGWNEENNHIIEYSLKLDSNPEFTASVIVAYARAAYRMYKEGKKGCMTVFDVAPAYLSPLSGEELRAHLL